MQVRVKILQGSHAGKEVKIPVPKCIIGRGDECHLRPQSDAISRRHCVIISNDQEVVVRDLNSRNGTYVNGERVAEEAVLLTGDVLRVGPLEFEMHIEQTAAKIKRPKITDIKQVVARTSEGSSHGSNSDLDDVTQWLEEGDAQHKTRAPETRQFRLDDTAHPPAAETKGEASKSDTGVVPAGETKAMDPDAAKQTGRPEKKAPGKLPPRPEAQAKDSREAAADMLKKFFNRR